jgi:hypothetical protein
MVALKWSSMVGLGSSLTISPLAKKLGASKVAATTRSNSLQMIAHLTSSHGGKSPIIVVRPDAKGNVTDADSPEDGLDLARRAWWHPHVDARRLWRHLYLAGTNGVLGVVTTP